MLEILLIEDNLVDAALVMRALDTIRASSSIHHLEDGEQALDFLFCQGIYCDRTPNLRPSLVLLDLKLPKVDGFEVLRQLKSNPKTRSIPIVILSSSQEEQDVKSTCTLGANSYIVKPVDFQEFTQTIREVGLYWLQLNQAPRNA
jgi:two-component system, response regulator